MSVLACAARRVKFYETAVEALSEAKEIAIRRGEDVHPLLQALTLLNLSAVLGDMDHDEQGLRWGLEAPAGGGRALDRGRPQGEKGCSFCVYHRADIRYSL